MKSFPSKGFVISCDEQSASCHTIIDTIGACVKQGQRININDIISQKSLPDYTSFLQSLKAKGHAVANQPMSTSNDIGFEWLYGIRNGESLLVAGCDSPDFIEGLNRIFFDFKEIASAGNREDGGAVSANGNHAYNETIALEDFMGVNNELINSKRELVKSNQLLLQQEERFREVIEKNPDPVFILDKNGRIVFMSMVVRDLAKGMPDNTIRIGAPPPFFNGEEKEVQFHQTGGETLTFDVSAVETTWDHQPATLLSLRDISQRKKVEDELQIICEELEERVSERTRSLEDMNATLRVLLDQREKDRLKLEAQVTTNMQLLIDPYMEQLQRATDDPEVLNQIKIIRSNVKDITAQFSHSLATEYRSLTANEIRVADLIRAGFSSKDIAEMRNVSIRTVEYYRKTIRKKLGLSGKKINLQTYLSDLARALGTV